jgi:hypothetical protein
MENLGKRARDKITGFEGIIIGMITYLFGCQQYGIAPKAKDGKLEDSHWFDVGRVEILGEGITPESVTADKPGGENRDAPKGENR